MWIEIIAILRFLNVYHMILAMHIWEPWQFKGKQSGNIRKVKQVKPGDGQSINQRIE